MKNLSIIDGLFVLSKKELILFYKHVYEQGRQNGILIEAGIIQDNQDSLSENLNVFLAEQSQTPDKTPKKHPTEICPFFDDSDFKEEWNEFQIVRKRKKASITERSTRYLLEKMMEYSEERKEIAIEIVRQSYMSGWSNIFPIKSPKNATPVKQSREEIWRNNY